MRARFNLRISLRGARCSAMEDELMFGGPLISRFNGLRAGGRGIKKGQRAAAMSAWTSGAGSWVAKAGGRRVARYWVFRR